MTKELTKKNTACRNIFYRFSTRNQKSTRFFKGASELLDKTENPKDRNKLFEIINHDVERIERLITDYTQMLKDEASLSREKM